MKTTENLIDDLTAGLEPVRRQRPSTWGWLLWMLLSVVFVVGVIHLAGPVRAVAWEQLQTVPRFTFEMLAGIGAALALALSAFRAAIPGAPRSKLGWLALVLCALWLASFVSGFFHPVLEPSMAGKRDHCVFETLLYGLPPLVGLLYWQRRMFSLQPGWASVLAGLASGVLPALYMQIACMYVPGHILLFHVAPALVLAACAPLLLWLMNRLLPTA